MTLGEKIARLASLQGMTYRELSDASGVPYTTLYSCAARGASRMKQDYISRVAHVLGVDYEYLSGNREDNETDAALADNQPFIFKTRVRNCLNKVDPEVAEELCKALPSFGSTLTMEEILDPMHKITPEDVISVSKLLGVSSYYLLGLIDSPTMDNAPGLIERAAAMRGADILTHTQTVREEIELALDTLQETVLGICYLPDTPENEREMETDLLPARISKITRCISNNKDLLQSMLRSHRYTTEL